MELDYIKVRDYEENKMDVSELGDFYVLSFSNKEHIKVSGQAKKIIEKFDGTKTIDEIIIELKKDNINFNRQDIERFINDFLISNSMTENSVIKGNNTSKLWFHYPLIKGERLSKIFLPFSFLYKDFIVLLVIVATFTLQMYFLKSGFYSTKETFSLYNLNSIGILAIVFMSFLIHELGHVIAALKYKTVVGDMGIGLYLFRPVFYTDLSNTWKLDRKKRIVTDLGGIYFQFISVFLLSLCLIFYNTTTIKVSILLILVSIIGNINPVLRFDGYWIITDLLGIVNVDKRAFEFIKSLFTNLIKNKKLSANVNINFKKGLKPFFYTYVFIYLVFTIGAVILGLYLVAKLAVNPEIFTTIFGSIYESVKNRNVGMFISRLNNSLIVLLPLLYIVLLLRTFVKSLLKIRIKLKK
jgi:putative peptide zinc metalloprotease protein